MSETENAFDRQRRDQYHQQNLTQEKRQGDVAEILHYLAELSVPLSKDDKVLEEVVTALTSTANLSAEQVRSNEWHQEIIGLLYLAFKPTEEGMHGGVREWAHDSTDANVTPLTRRERIQVETDLMNGKLALTRSEDFRAVEEATRNVSESIVHDEPGNNSGDSSGILGRLRS